MPKKRNKPERYVPKLPRLYKGHDTSSYTESQDRTVSQEQTGTTTAFEKDFTEYNNNLESKANQLNNNNNDIVNNGKETNEALKTEEKQEIKEEMQIIEEEIPSTKLNQLGKKIENEQKENTKTQQTPDSNIIIEEKVEEKVEEKAEEKIEVKQIIQTETVEHQVIEEIKTNDSNKISSTKDVILRKKKPQILYTPNRARDKKRHSIEQQMYNSDFNIDGNKEVRKPSILKKNKHENGKPITTFFSDTRFNTEANSNLNTSDNLQSKGFCPDCIIC